MHSIDRTLQEFGSMGQQEYQQENFEFTNEFAGEFSNEMGYENAYEMEFENENFEVQATYELMEVSNEMELNQFLGGLLKTALGAAKGAAKSFISSPQGKALGGQVMNFGKSVLPKLASKYGGQALGALAGKAGTYVGNKIGGSVGSAIASGAKQGGQYLGQQIGGWAGGQAGNFIADKAKQIFNLELEGLSPEQQEFEISRAFVRFANDSFRRGYQMYRKNPRISPVELSRRAIITRVYNDSPYTVPAVSGGFGQQQGTWYRQADGSIILQGL